MKVYRACYFGGEKLDVFEIEAVEKAKTYKTENNETISKDSIGKLNIDGGATFGLTHEEAVDALRRSMVRRAEMKEDAAARLRRLSVLPSTVSTWC